MALVIRFMSIPSNDVLRLAKFWQQALGQQATGTATGALIASAELEGAPAILIEEAAAGAAVATGIAFSPSSGTLAGEVGRLVGLGARVLRKYHRGCGLGEVTLADPEGNTFQIISGSDEVQAVEVGQEPVIPSQFWDDAEQAPDLSTTGGTYVLVRSGEDQSQ